MSETAEIGDIKTPLPAIVKKLGTFDEKTEFYSEETPLGNPLIPEFNAISKVSKICRMTGVDEEKWAQIEKNKYANYTDRLMANHEYPQLVSLNAIHICTLIEEGKYDEASSVAAQLGIGIDPAVNTLPDEYLTHYQDSELALEKFREYIDRSKMDAKRKIALAFLQAGQIERADAVRGDPAILSPIDYLYFTLSYIPYYDSVGDFTSAQRYIDDITSKWELDDHGGLPNHMSIPIDNIRRNQSLALFENDRYDEAFTLLDSISGKFLRNKARMELISACGRKGLIRESETIANDILYEVSEKIDPAVVGITLSNSQRQDYFDEIGLLASLAATVAREPGLESIYQKCMHGDGNFPGALTRMHVVTSDLFRPEWIDIFKALEKAGEYELIDTHYEQLHHKLSGEQTDLLSGEYAVVIMNRDQEKAAHIISSIADLQLKADYLRLYIFKLLESKESLSGWQQWVKKLKDIEEMISPDSVDFSTFYDHTTDDEMTSPSLALSSGGVALIQNDMPYDEESDEQRYFKRPSKELLFNLALLAIQKGDTASFEELLNSPDMANDYAVEVMKQAVDYFYRKKEVKLL